MRKKKGVGIKLFAPGSAREAYQRVRSSGPHGHNSKHGDGDGDDNEDDIPNSNSEDSIMNHQHHHHLHHDHPEAGEQSFRMLESVYRGVEKQAFVADNNNNNHHHHDNPKQLQNKRSASTERTGVMTFASSLSESLSGELSNALQTTFTMFDSLSQEESSSFERSQSKNSESTGAEDMTADNSNNTSNSNNNVKKRDNKPPRPNFSLHPSASMFDLEQQTAEDAAADSFAALRDLRDVEQEFETIELHVSKASAIKTAPLQRSQAASAQQQHQLEQRDREEEEIEMLHPTKNETRHSASQPQQAEQHPPPAQPRQQQQQKQQQQASPPRQQQQPQGVLKVATEPPDTADDEQRMETIELNESTAAEAAKFPKDPPASGESSVGPSRRTTTSGANTRAAAIATAAQMKVQATDSPQQQQPQQLANKDSSWHRREAELRIRRVDSSPVASPMHSLCSSSSDSFSSSSGRGISLLDSKEDDDDDGDDGNVKRRWKKVGRSRREGDEVYTPGSVALSTYSMFSEYKDDDTMAVLQTAFSHVVGCNLSFLLREDDMGDVGSVAAATPQAARNKFFQYMFSCGD